MPATLEDLSVTPWLTGHHRASDGTITSLAMSGGVPVDTSGSTASLIVKAVNLLPGHTVTIAWPGTYPAEYGSAVLGGTLSRTVTTTNASTECVMASGTGFLRIGMSMTGSGIPGGATVTRITDGTHFTLSAAATSTATITGTFSHPARAITATEVMVGSETRYGMWRLFALQCYDDSGAPVSVGIDSSALGAGFLPSAVSGACLLPLPGSDVFGGTEDSAIVLTANHASGLATLELRIVCEQIGLPD